jgi:hypothetical protein
MKILEEPLKNKMIEKKLTKKEKSEIRKRKIRDFKIIGIGVGLLALLTNHLDGNQKERMIREKEYTPIESKIDSTKINHSYHLHRADSGVYFIYKNQVGKFS